MIFGVEGQGGKKKKKAFSFQQLITIIGESVVHQVIFNTYHVFNEIFKSVGKHSKYENKIFEHLTHAKVLPANEMMLKKEW